QGALPDLASSPHSPARRFTQRPHPSRPPYTTKSQHSTRHRMSKKAAVPDAWDDDWEAIADKADETAAVAAQEETIKVSKAERLARHAETNKKIWDSAEEPETFHFLAAKEDKVPLRTEFKPQLKVLSRKPAPKVVQRLDPVTGLAKLTVEADDEEEEDSKNKPTAEELRIKAQREREEKQRRYDEARARILGTPSGPSSPGTTTPPDGGRGKGRGRGGVAENRRPNSQGGPKELFDPNYTPKSGGVNIQKRNGEASSRSGASTPRDDDQIIRTPKGPDGNGKGFANRGGKKT
ncbi:hypothetical protein LOCC1_G004203, partial [Lachnellula occidentalis]